MGLVHRRPAARAVVRGSASGGAAVAEARRVDGGGEGGGPKRPPSVAEATWNLVPDRLRSDALSRASADLRRGIHPEESMRSFLEERGIRRTEPRRTMARPIGRRVDRETHDEVVPSTPIGVAIHKAMRLSGRPGRSAAAAEVDVVEAIRRDPAYAWWDPEGLGALGARTSRETLGEIADLIRWQAEREMGDLRARRDAGDPSAAAWVDPDDWCFNLDGADAVPFRSP